MSDKKPKKPQKLRARLPRGLVDRTPSEIAATRAMVETIRAVYERYGFEPVETPAMEYTDALGKFLPDQDRPNEGVFSFQDDDEQWISLRYDLTAPLARYVAENFDTLPKPYRSYRNGYVYRNEKPGPGRFRQFMQFDADTVGSASPAADAEMCMMAADTMEALGIPRGSYVVKVNNRKVLDGVMESIGLGGDENAGRRLTVLRAIDKLDKFPVDEIKKLLGSGRWDGGEEGKGDFTKGAGLDSEQTEKIVVFALLQSGNVTELQDVTNLSSEKRSTVGKVLTFSSDDGDKSYFVESNKGVIDGMMTHFGSTQTAKDGIEELRQIATLAESSGYTRDRIRIDPSVVRGLEYYTGPVYEVELLLETKDEKGRPVRFGSVGGGGRYDGLVSRFRGEPVPATGFSIGVSRLQAALDYIHRDAPKKIDFGPVVVLVMDRNEIAQYQKFVTTLRNAGIRAEMYLGNPKNNLGVQFKYADRRNSPCVVIQGESERNNPRGEPVVVIKDMILGAEIATATSDRDAHLQKQMEAQVAVKESELVEGVRKVLARHNVSWQ
ncbi:histidine--tRNA ligase [[Pseudomonas] carboxydohydrogena]|uniref:Histidine--tRNA ligase n=1 Tax=Afipia carboxydohydrogena TaxID=290 RepID=A0ABY8BMH4_AFICR|nr:histidine--tRNA ligase [[Pseudomonas] carboxydohydrogena]WEF51189.1 histidine--tRNA ligase [[Pseudomonas] carboxydohydrogena]